MTIGSRIAALRKKNNYSQEYVAEKLGVSRQAVSKWERDLSHPDTQNLIQLAELFSSTVEYIAIGKENAEDGSCNFIATNKQKLLSKKKKIKLALFCTLAAFVICIVGALLYVKTRDVAWDAGACGGGYGTYVFDKYENVLVEKFINGFENKAGILEVKALRGTQEVSWKDQKIFLEFDIRYIHETEGAVTYRVHFIGTRIWIDTYSWSGAIIEG